MGSVAGSSALASPMYSRTTIDDASGGIGTHCAPPSLSAGGSVRREHERERAGVELEVGVADVAGHPARGQPVPASTWKPR